MRKHLNLGDVKPAEVTQDTVKAVAQALRDSASLKVSEDGQFQDFFFLFSLVVPFLWGNSSTGA